MNMPDVDVIKYMEWPGKAINERPTYWQIAKQISRSPNFVRKMVEEMIENNSLRGMSVFINPTMIGLRAYFLVVTCDDSDPLMAEEFRNEVGGVYALHVSGLHREIVNIEMYKENDDDLRRAMQKIEKLLPHCNIMYSTFQKYDNVVVDEKTLEIIGYLISHPMDSVNKISLETGIPRSVVKRKIERIKEQDLINIRPNFNAYKYRKLNLAIIGMAVDDSLVKVVRMKSIDILGDYIIQERKDINGMLLFLTNFSHLDDAKPSIEKLKKLEGVYSVQFVFPFESNFYVPEIVKERISKITGKPFY